MKIQGMNSKDLLIYTGLTVVLFFYVGVYIFPVSEAAAVGATAARITTTVSVANYTKTNLTSSLLTDQDCGPNGTLNCRYSSWTGVWLMPDDQSLMLAFNVATGPTNAASRTLMSEISLNFFKDKNNRGATHVNPAPSGRWYLDKGKDFFGLSGGCPASPALPTTQPCSQIVYLKSTTFGQTWSVWRTDSFQALNPIAYTPQPTIAVKDSFNDTYLIRRVNGDDLRNLQTIPHTALLQTVKPPAGNAALSWPTLGAAGQNVFPDPDPTFCKYQISRIRKLEDQTGRYIAIGQVWKYANGATSGECNAFDSVPYSNLLLVAADADAVKNGQWKIGMPYVPVSSIDLQSNEWDAAQLDNGDLLAVMRTDECISYDTKGRCVVETVPDVTPIRRQARLIAKSGADCPAPTDGAIGCWIMDTASLGNPGGFPHSGHPELLSVVENGVRVVLHLADVGGISYTLDEGQTWQPLMNGAAQLATEYYPRAVKDPVSGYIFVFSHDGGDNPYGGLEANNYSGIYQSIIMQKFQLSVTSPPPTPPTVTTNPATSVGTTTATLNGVVNPNGKATSYYFQYGLTTSYGSNTSTQNLAAGSANVSVSANLNGLTPNTTYNFRLRATNADGTVSGVNRTFTTGGTGGTSYYQSVLNSNPVSYWRLGEASGASAADQKGANPASYVNSVVLGATGAVPNNTAASFDGVNDHVLAPDSASLDTGDVFTAEAWIKRGSVGTSQAIVNKFGSYFLYFDGANKLVLYKPNNGSIAVSTVAISDTTNFHHVAATKNGATVKLYIDGTDVTGAVTNRTVANSTGGFYIGSGSGYFKGVIDEVAVYNTALTAGAIAAHYAARNNP